MSEVKRNVAANITRMAEAENGIMSAAEQPKRNTADLTNAVKRIAYLETKTKNQDQPGWSWTPIEPSSWRELTEP